MPTYIQDNYSVRRLYWADQESTSLFQPSDTNAAGSFDLSTDGTAICGKAARGMTLIWTSSDLWSMKYIGGSFIYSFERVANNCGIVGPNAAVVIDAGAFWMSTGRFHWWDGYAKTIPCSVTDYVFGDFSSANAFKAWAFANPQFGEVTWHYASGLATNPDRYVTYNYVEDHWSFGQVARSIGVSRRAGATVPVPVMIDANGVIYDHETGDTRTGQTAYLESGPIEIGDGDQVMRLQRIVPDDQTLGDVQMYVYTSMYPDASETESGPYTAADPTNIRLTARQARLRVEEVGTASWRLGTVRLGAIPGGRR